MSPAKTRRTEYPYDDFGNVRTVKQLADTPNSVTTTYTYEHRSSSRRSIRTTTRGCSDTMRTDVSRASRIRSAITLRLVVHAQRVIRSVTDPLRTHDAGWLHRARSDVNDEPLGLRVAIVHRHRGARVVDNRPAGARDAAGT